MPSYEAVRPSQAPGYLLQSSRGEGFFSEEERARRRKVLERIPVLSNRYETGLNQASISDNGSFENDRNTRRSSLSPVNRTEVELQQFKDTGSSLMNSDNQQINGRESKMSMNTSYSDTINEEIYQSVLNNQEIRDKLATRAFYTSTTQKLYQGADWSASKSYRPDPPSTTLEPRPDMVTQRIKRYEENPECWQRFSSKPFTWDFSQTRNGHYVNRPIAFTNEKGGQIPNYMGHIAGEGEKDVNGESFMPMTKLRLSKPRYTMTSKRGYVPGYTGCVYWANSVPPLSAEKEPRRESTARAHKRFNTPRSSSGFNHQGPLSRMVTMTHPFNPYNKTNPFEGMTASGNRV